MKRYKLIRPSAFPTDMKDGIYSGKYNFEPCVYRMKDRQPVFVQFIDNSSIFKPNGILMSSVQIYFEL